MQTELLLGQSELIILYNLKTNYKMRYTYIILI